MGLLGRIRNKLQHPKKTHQWDLNLRRISRETKTLPLDHRWDGNVTFVNS